MYIYIYIYLSFSRRKEGRKEGKRNRHDYIWLGNYWCKQAAQRRARKKYKREIRGKEKDILLEKEKVRGPDKKRIKSQFTIKEKMAYKKEGNRSM